MLSISANLNLRWKPEKCLLLVEKAKMTIGGPNKGHTSNWTYFQPGAVSEVWSGGCKVITPPWNRPCFQRIINLDNNMFISNKQCDHFQGYWVMYMTSHIPIKEVIYFLTWSFITFYGYSNFSDFWGHLKYLKVIVFFFVNDH